MNLLSVFDQSCELRWAFTLSGLFGRRGPAGLVLTPASVAIWASEVPRPPLRATCRMADLAHLPATVLAVAQYDPPRD
jgi:hypothetical protein